MRIHILGICGTFMGGIAALARERGIEVEGSDANVYPPMSDQLRALGITLLMGFAVKNLTDDFLVRHLALLAWALLGALLGTLRGAPRG